VAWRTADTLRLYLLERTSRRSHFEARDNAPAAVKYLSSTIEAAAKEQPLLAAPLKELKRAPHDEQVLEAFKKVLEAALRRDAALAKRLEDWTLRNVPPIRGLDRLPPPILDDSPSGGLAGGGLESVPTNDHNEAVAAGGPEPASANGDQNSDPKSVQAWLNAELEDAEASQPLVVGESYTLAFSLDQAAKHTIIASGAPFNFLFPQGTEEVVFTVQLDSADFEVFERSRPLRFRRPGVARGKARFDVVPLRNGRCQLVATVHHAGNFLQQLTLTLDVGVAAARPLESSTLGRPIADAAALHPRDIGFAIEPAPEGGYTCTAWGATAARVHLPIQQHELESAIEQVRQALLDVVGKRTFQFKLDIPPEDRDAALGLLAKAGFRLYQKIFYHPAGGADARRIGEWLRQQATATNEVLKIQLVTRGFPVPWGLLYIDEEWNAEAIDWQRFLGMSHIIEQIPLQTTLTTPNGIIDSGSAGLSVSVNFNESIDQQMRADFVARQVSYWGAVVDFNPPVKVVSRTKRDELVSALKNGATPDQVLYLYCHAVAAGLTGGGPDSSFLVLSGDEHVTLGDLNLEAPTTVQLAGSPLVFINACESAELSPSFYDGFVPYFMAKGARGVIGTECKTPALFAADWASTFFDLFLDGGSLGEIFLRMRRQYFEQHGNPLGLVYGVHCDGDTRVHPAMIRSST
jgi:hypothetical protein